MKFFIKEKFAGWVLGAKFKGKLYRIGYDQDYREIRIWKIRLENQPVNNIMYLFNYSDMRPEVGCPAKMKDLDDL